MAPSHLTLSEVENSRSPKFHVKSVGHTGFKPYLIKEQRGHKLLLTINRKPYMFNTTTILHLTLSETSNSRSPRFQSLASRKGA